MTKVRQLIDAAVRALPSPSSPGREVHLLLSGGVDSSVSAFLLRERGYSVRPYILRCWDLPFEPGTSRTSSPSCFESELRGATDAASLLGLRGPLVTDLVSAYWVDVFEDVLLRGLRSGRTPNPDIACNVAIKFGHFPSYVSSYLSPRDDDDIHAPLPLFATGHYARTDGTGKLLRAVDTVKDQTYFLSAVSSNILTQFLFPVGSLRKQDVRAIAHSVGLSVAPSSRGLCFVGARSGPAFNTFVSQFMNETRHAMLVDAISGAHISAARWPAWAYTVGQRARAGGAPAALYVVGTRVAENEVVVARAGDERLFCKQVWCPEVCWVDGTRPKEGRVMYKASSVDTMKNATLRYEHDGEVWITFDVLTPRVADGQAIVLYDGDVCLGAVWPRDRGEWDVRRDEHKDKVVDVMR